MARKNKGERRAEGKPLMLAGNVVIPKMKQLVGKEIGKKYPCVFPRVSGAANEVQRRRQPDCAGQQRTAQHPLKEDSLLENDILS